MPPCYLSHRLRERLIPHQRKGDKTLKKLLVLLAMVCLFYTGHGRTDGPDPMIDDWDNPDTMEVKGKGEFYFRVQYRDDLHNAAYMFGEVKVKPSEGKWPGVDVNINKGYSHEVNAHINFQIRDISVPLVEVSRARPHIQVERERRRGDAAASYVWAIISQSETLIISQPTAVGYNVIEGDLFAVIGGLRLNVADMLNADGHGRIGDAEWDWGLRIPEER